MRVWAALGSDPFPGVEHRPCSCPVSADGHPSCARPLVLGQEMGLAGEARSVGRLSRSTTVTLSTGQALSWESCPALGPEGGAAAARAQGQGLWSLDPRGATS